MSPSGRVDRTQNTARTSRTGMTSYTTRTSLTSGWTTVLAPGSMTRRARWQRKLRRFVRRVSRRWSSIRDSVGAVVTPIGWGVIASALLLVSMGFIFSWTEMIVMGLTLVFLTFICAIFLLGQIHYEAELYVSAERTVVGYPVTAGVRIADRGRRPLWGSRVEVHLGDGIVELKLPPRRTGGTAGSEFAVPADHRGVVKVGPVRTIQGDPVGLFRRNKEWSQTQDVFIHPQTVSLPSTSTGMIRDLEGNPTRDLTASDISFHALREFRPGDERRHIHWKSTARTGQLTVRQFEETRRSHIVVAFGLHSQDYASEEEFELAVSAATSIGLRAVRDGRELTMVTSPIQVPAGDIPSHEPQVIPTLSRHRLLDAVSKLNWSEADIGLGDLSRIAAHTVGGISIVFIVCGSAPSMRELRSWSLRFPVGIHIVAIVCQPQASPSLRRVAELNVLTIGYLDDMVSALSRAAAA